MRVERKPEFLKCRIQTNNNPRAAFCHVVYRQYYIISAKLSLLTRIVPLVKTFITFSGFCTSALTIKLSEAQTN